MDSAAAEEEETGPEDEAGQGEPCVERPGPMLPKIDEDNPISPTSLNHNIPARGFEDVCVGGLGPPAVEGRRLERDATAEGDSNPTGGKTLPAAGDAQDASPAAPHGVREEDVRLHHEHEGMKAKFELTLQTLQAVLRIPVGCTWADVVEKVDALAHEEQAKAGRSRAHSSEDRRRSQDDKSRGDGSPAADDQEDVDPELALAREETRQADMECERLEEQLEAQSARVAQLRELLRKQQRLLDLTALQIENQDAQSQRQGEALADLEAKEAVLLNEVANKDRQIAAMLEERSHLQEDISQRTETTRKQEQELREKAARLVQLEEELRITRWELTASEDNSQHQRQEIERQAQELERLRLDSERRREEGSELSHKYSLECQHTEHLRGQLQVYEAAERRRCSYNTGAQGNRAPSLHSVGTGSESDSTLLTVDQVPMSARSGYGSARRQGGEGSEFNGSERGFPLFASRSGAASTSDLLDNQERDAFLSHFPMASRTERQFRDKLEERRRHVNATVRG
eukprot:TRINITY_DN84003_c0_g1_i1.p1 TRINITY_DN84003_c0_g1~~TRINITY_DN84003_c0_g1_i1.p1  ORF type:complete len:533 (+),score=138.09 TRINITY_DN84003_c0_g1_i1:52-1599(+)